MEKTIYRAVTDSIFKNLKHLQFKSTFRFLFWRFTCWRYVPDSYVANCFKESDCPFLWLPFTTSHCFFSYWKEKEVADFISKNPDIKKYLKEMKEDINEKEKTKYF